MPARFCIHSVLALVVFLARPVDASGPVPDSTKGDRPDRGVEAFPILSYDTDVGFGYGIKLFVLDALRASESFDLIVFNSTKGERWYRLVVSMPDFEQRQGTEFPLSVDVTIDYDKYLKNPFFGVGHRTLSSSRETYTREPLELHLALGRGITRSLVLQASARWKRVLLLGIVPGGTMNSLPEPERPGLASVLMLGGLLRYDARDSFVHPTEGVVVQGEAERSVHAANSGAFWKLSGSAQYYLPFVRRSTVLAGRLSGSMLRGDGIPVQFLLPVGGNQTLRGFQQDRFLDKVSAVANIELRTHLLWRFWGVVGADAGRVWAAPGYAGLAGWNSNAVAGLRLLMETFVVRADLGFSREDTGFYLNFGHLF